MDGYFIAYSLINSLFATQTFFSPLCACVCVCVCVSLTQPPPLHPFYLYPQTKHGYLQSNEEEEFLQQVSDVLQKTKLEKKKPSPKLQTQEPPCSKSPITGPSLISPPPRRRPHLHHHERRRVFRPHLWSSQAVWKSRHVLLCHLGQI